MPGIAIWKASVQYYFFLRQIAKHMMEKQK